MGQDFFQTREVNRAEPYSWAAGLPPASALQPRWSQRPSTSYTDQSLAQMGQSTAQNLPMIQEYLQRTLRTGGINGTAVGEYLSNVAKSRVGEEARLGRDVSAAFPLGSTAAVSALSGGLGDIGTKYRTLEDQFLLSQAQQEEANKQAAVTGMYQLPSYLNIPGAAEREKIQTAWTPYEQMDTQSQNIWNQLMAALIQDSQYLPEINYRDTGMGSLLGAIIKAIPSFFA